MLTFDSIFLSKLQEEEENPYYIVTAFVDSNIEYVPDEFTTLIAKIERKYPDFKILLCTEATSVTALERGSLFFVEHCCLGFTLFAHTDGEIKLDYQNMELNTLLKRAVQRNHVEMKKINAFVNAADGLIAEKQFGIAAFNLHQAFELSFRFIEQMCLGESKITHSIISHIKYCTPFFPKLKPFLEGLKMENNELLLLLEHAYSVARYGEEYQISETQVDRIRAEFNDFIKVVETLYKKHLNQCREQLNVTDNCGDETLKTDTTNDTPKKDVPAESVSEDLIKAKINELIHKKQYKIRPEATESFYKTEFMITGIADVLYDIASIMKVCIISLDYTNSYFNKLIPQPNMNVKTALEHILQMLPFEEMECLEEIIKEYGLPNEISHDN